MRRPIVRLLPVVMLGALAVFAMGSWGKGDVDAMQAATGDTLATATAGTYTFATPVVAPQVQTVATFGGVLYVRFNAATCSATDWDAVIGAGDMVVIPAGAGRVSTVTLYQATGGNKTLGTDFVVKGWPE